MRSLLGDGGFLYGFDTAILRHFHGMALLPTPNGLNGPDEGSWKDHNAAGITEHAEDTSMCVPPLRRRGG